MKLIVFLIGLTILNIGVLLSIDWKDNWFGVNKKIPYKKYSRDDLLRMDGFEFEQFMAGIFKKHGYKRADVTPKSNDYGRDIELKDKEGNITFVECKRYEDEYINRERVQKLIGACVGMGVKRAIFCTTSLFNSNANGYLCDVLSNSDIELIYMDCDDLLKYINELYECESEESIEDTVILDIEQG